jgi:hypothetical protein
MLLVFRGLWNDGTSASMYREIMLRNRSIFQISTLICLNSRSICNLLIDLSTYIYFPRHVYICAWRLWNFSLWNLSQVATSFVVLSVFDVNGYVNSI